MKQTDGLTTSTIDVVKKALQPRDERLAALEQRVAALESAPKG